MKTHNLKTHPQYFNAVLNGEKYFELRKNDRDFAVGDTVVLNEYVPDFIEAGIEPDHVSIAAFTNRKIEFSISSLLQNVPEYGLMPGYCIIGFNAFCTHNCDVTDEGITTEKQIYTRTQVIKVIDELLQRPDMLTDAIGENKHDLDAEELLIIADLSKGTTSFDEFIEAKTKAQ